MNCEKFQELTSDLLDGSLSPSDQLLLHQHLEGCLDCAAVRRDLESIVGFCQAHRGEYESMPNQAALWLRISNVIESERGVAVSMPVGALPGKQSWAGWFNRTWELSLPQLAASVAALIIVVSLTTLVVLRQGEAESPSGSRSAVAGRESISINNRTWQQQQAINYWNQRVELNKVRWSQDMRDTFERNLKVIDQTVSDSLGELNRNPHDEVSEEMLNAALNEKLTLLKEFADL